MRYRIPIGCVVVAAALGVAGVLFQNRPAEAAGKDDEQAIQKATEAYADAFNKGDVDAILAEWAPDSEYIDDEGKSFKGRDALAALFKETVKDSKGNKVQIKTTAIRFFNDIAWQDGAAIVTQANGQAESSPFTAIWTKKDGKWLMSLVRDQPNQPIVEKDEPNAKLKALGWLVGDWVHEDKGVKTTLKAHWMKGEKFLITNMTVVDKGVEVMELIQVVGWDPTGDRLHSWLFDTRGGFGEGYWTNKGKTWTVDAAGITADGRRGTGTHLWKFADDNSFTWEGTDRDIEGQALPDVSVTYHREKKAK